MAFTEMDENVTSAIKNWFYHGLHPGSFAWCLVTGELANSFLHAHYLLTVGSVKNMFNFTSLYLPREAKTKEWKGYNNLSDVEKKAIKKTATMINIESEELFKSMNKHMNP